MAPSHRATRTRDRLAGAAVVTTLVAGGLLASLGAGYSVSRAVLSDGSAYVAKGTTIGHVNGESGKLDAQTPGNLATGKQGLQVVKLPSGQLIVVNQHTHAVTAIDAATMQPDGAVLPAEAAPGAVDHPTDVRVITSGKVGWLVDATGGSVALFGAQGPSTKQVKLDAAITDAAPGPDGSIIVLTKDGVVVRVGTNLKPHRTPISDGAGGTLTSAGGHSFLITSAGEVLQVDADQPRTLAKPAGLDANVIAGSVDGAGEHVLAIEHDVLLLIDAGSAATQSVPLHAGAATLGRPVELAGRVYIPDYTNHRLLVANEDTGRLDTPIKVPGTTATFALFVSGGRVWANDQFSQRMVAVNADGTWLKIDKGTGKGVEDPDAKPPKTPPATKPPKGGTPIPRPNPGGHTTPIPRPVSPQPGPTIPVAVPAPALPKLVAVPSFGANTDYHDACARIEALQLRCTPVAVDASGRSGNTGEVVDTVPGGGAQVQVGSQVVLTYLGQLTVPNGLTGGTPDEACAAVVAAQLKCVPKPSGTPATNAAEFGIVNDNSPSSGTKVNTGSTVVISYPDTFLMPDFSNQAGDASCRSLAAYQLTINNTTTSPTCTSATGNTAPSAAQSGQVYAQTPAPAAPAPASATAALTVYNGSVHVKDWTGADANAALAECQATPGLSCTLADGDYPGGNPGNAGKVESQTPPGDYAVVAAVTITRWRLDNVVPNVTGGDKDAGCAAIQASGFVCGDAPGPVGPTQNLVVSQDQGAGSALPLGSTVTYHYSAVGAGELVLYQANSGASVYVLRFAGAPPPAGYGASGGTHIGFGYAPGSPYGDRMVNGYFCTASPTLCEGPPENHFYSQIGSYANAGWQGPSALVQTFGSCPGGTVHMFRSWLFASPIDHRYFLTVGAPAGGTNGSEDLGCIWP